MRISSTSLWIPQKFTCRGWNSWLFNPFSMKSFEEFCHTDSFSLSNLLYFSKRTQTNADVCSLDVYFPCLTLLNQKMLFQTSVIVFNEERNAFECFPLLWFHVGVVCAPVFSSLFIGRLWKTTNSALQVSWEYCSGSVRAASVKVPYFGDWIINFMNDSNRNLFITSSNQHFWSFLSECLSNDWWHVFFFEIGRDVEGIEVLEVLSMTYAVFAVPSGARRQVLNEVVERPRGSSEARRKPEWNEGPYGPRSSEAGGTPGDEVGRSHMERFFKDSIHPHVDQYRKSP